MHILERKARLKVELLNVNWIWYRDPCYEWKRKKKSILVVRWIWNCFLTENVFRVCNYFTSYIEVDKLSRYINRDQRVHQDIIKSCPWCMRQLSLSSSISVQIGRRIDSNITVMDFNITIINSRFLKMYPNMQNRLSSFFWKKLRLIEE